MQFDIKFINTFQDKIFHESKRNICASGGFGNGKTTVCCQKFLALALQFPNSRWAIFRSEYKKLASTTRVTFFKLCPPEFYDPLRGGNRADSTGLLTLINGSQFLWLHSDNTDDKILMGLEVNGIFIDQAEELDEQTYDIMDGRVGRWDMAKIPDFMNGKPTNFDDFPLNEATGRRVTPSYMLLGCNPSDLSHFIYRRYHKDSEEHAKDQHDEVTGETWRYSDNHVMYEATSADNPALSSENLRILRRKGKAFREKFYLGKWGVFEGQVHEISPSSIIDYFPEKLLNTFLTEGRLYRVLDHGTSAPTCCLWFSLYKQWLLCYREYYLADARITEHRRAISELSENEEYTLNLCDPDICKKRKDKFGHAASIADDYADNRLDAPPLYWQPADSNEFRTRNAVDEMLFVDPDLIHPITNRQGSSRLLFLKRGVNSPQGCQHAISETRRQRRVEMGTIEGQTHFSDKRVDGIPDHAYDDIRYMCSYRTTFIPKLLKPKRIEGTFKGALMSHKNRRLRYGNVGVGISTF